MAILIIKFIYLKIFNIYISIFNLEYFIQMPIIILPFNIVYSDPVIFILSSYFLYILSQRDYFLIKKCLYFIYINFRF